MLVMRNGVCYSFLETTAAAAIYRAAALFDLTCRVDLTE